NVKYLLHNSTKPYDTGTQDYVFLPHKMKPSTKCKDRDMPDMEKNSGGSFALSKKTKKDPQLNAYRRLPSSNRKTSNTELDKTLILGSPSQCKF
ncbi:hypothetical protein VP01_9077g1, partial [Puccinia sorghi]